MLPFIEARHYTRTSGREIEVVVIHTMEAPEANNTAENVALWFAGPNAPQASAHYCVDADSVVRCVRDKDVAWAAPGCNHNGLQVELAGRAGQTPKEWGDAYSDALLANAAQLVAELCKRHKLPVRRLHAADLKAGRRGITGHADVSEAFKRSNHWDPGPNFPWAEFIRQVKGGEAKRLPPLPGPVPKPRWFWEALVEFERRKKSAK